ncbi:MarR family winged helix-turn-helix transcriptional regulator [Breoghania sp.]|uniref:MarR family winged helix-turn-helix transcriptional regulator n=1 Tax=Breoghania sp. TaxID=2065378 RepID=UPI002AAB2FC7|nr:MarR family winged helix-turn-helix transcriptional regulator [Breoghania sp.]
MAAARKDGARKDGAHGSGSGRGDALQLENWLPYRFFRISVRIADVLSAFYGPRFGLSRPAWRTMAIVANRPGASAKEISQAAGLDPFSVSRAVRQLVELGFAHRLAGRVDRRCVAIELSHAGWEAFCEISDLAGHLDRELTEAVDPEELAKLGSVLDRLESASAGILARDWQSMGDTPRWEEPATRG